MSSNSQDRSAPVERRQDPAVTVAIAEAVSSIFLMIRYLLRVALTVYLVEQGIDPTLLVSLLTAK
ncbi:hypothetical protein [Nonomuraea recticatena]|uniref:MFS transporter n=1 Tax=Nonomuraea recticatena TaxID=46178 RepID=A0ABN3T2N1_9ACTN